MDSCENLLKNFKRKEKKNWHWDAKHYKRVILSSKNVLHCKVFSLFLPFKKRKKNAMSIGIKERNKEQGKKAKMDFKKFLIIVFSKNNFMPKWNSRILACWLTTKGLKKSKKHVPYMHTHNTRILTHKWITGHVDIVGKGLRSDFNAWFKIIHKISGDRCVIIWEKTCNKYPR